MIQRVKNFIRSAAGNVALAASILALPLIGVGGMALDYVYLYRLEANLQKAADSAALSSARELGLANVSPEILDSVATNYVFTNLGQNAIPEDIDVAAVASGNRCYCIIWTIQLCRSKLRQLRNLQGKPEFVCWVLIPSGRSRSI